MQPDQPDLHRQPATPASSPPPRADDGTEAVQSDGAAPGNTQGLVGMILGVAALPLLFAFYMGIPLGIVGAVLGHLGRRRADAGLATNRGQASTGLVCGAIAVVLGVVLVVLNVVAFRTMDLNTYVSTA